ncbi:zeaxanthin 7,8(7',8')-cleavage dioxygenase, chromoplastic-like [Selaginella moellendorffii]|uniref:zeaxanthin 7,8(7',8')-cleavage dioxygenase, chromoplastic-like n=1 Tax=Selaginella moellendorffii TaxID=88036 RepID=UPI000D1C67D3|nr:zeaxanthin 7,8(7',8')-cleavage dioxygenase, chromoplastic-like [Selaginella moellendorffii]|eukprot:XP_024531312.1 zeaxanthin 7,8(7',8')-cleavage dioxygenase, chromoplastic-like [Selaginella moellendorffii]
MCYYGPWPKICGLAKVDLVWRRGDSNVVSFVANGEEEDDGYIILSYVHDEKNGVSELLVMDAKSPTLEIVASIELPAGVPYGFHGIFINANQIANQNHATV